MSVTIAAQRRKTEPGDQLSAFQMLDGSMEPRFFAGEKLIVNRSVAPKIGDDDGEWLRLSQFRDLAVMDVRAASVSELTPIVFCEPGD